MPTDTPPPPHPRDLACEAAGNELQGWALDWAARHQLTGAEQQYLLGVLLFRALQQAALDERRGGRLVEVLDRGEKT